MNTMVSLLSSARGCETTPCTCFASRTYQNNGRTFSRATAGHHSVELWVSADTFLARTLPKPHGVQLTLLPPSSPLPTWASGGEEVHGPERRALHTFDWLFRKPWRTRRGKPLERNRWLQGNAEERIPGAITREAQTQHFVGQKK